MSAEKNFPSVAQRNVGTLLVANSGMFQPATKLPQPILNYNVTVMLWGEVLWKEKHHNGSSHVIVGEE